MSFFNFIWLFINIVLIVLILIKSPNEQSFQETIQSLNLIDSSTDAERNLNKLIQFFIFTYFIIGFLFTTKIF